eukprot:6214833-Pleurochrysis_carterae.AAC.2
MADSASSVPCYGIVSAMLCRTVASVAGSHEDSVFERGLRVGQQLLCAQVVIKTYLGEGERLRTRQPIDVAQMHARRRRKHRLTTVLLACTILGWRCFISQSGSKPPSVRMAMPMGDPRDGGRESTARTDWMASRASLTLPQSLLGVPQPAIGMRRRNFGGSRAGGGGDSKQASLCACTPSLWTLQYAMLG